MRYETRFYLFALFFTLLTACGDDKKNEDKCLNITCEVGVCLEGECANPEICDASSLCLEGFDCESEVCVAQEIDKCKNTECPRGICSKDSGECVNKTVCEQDAEIDCLAGFVCYGQTCQDENTICAELDCLRGVCVFENIACENGEMCASDMECLEGFFCNDEKACEQNRCDADMVQCDRGVCNKKTGACEDKDTCSREEECVDGKYCIGNTCTPIEEACSSCTGNQVCKYGSLRTTCEESMDACTNGFDCLGDRVCVNNMCADPSACIPDLNEPNNDAMTATSWKDIANAGAIHGSLCKGDADFYLYNTRDSDLFSGTLVVTLSIKNQDLGNGSFTIDLLKNGLSVANVTSSNTKNIELRHQIAALNVGEFTIKISDKDLGPAGLEYDLFISLLSPETDQACQNSIPIMGMKATGNTHNSQSTALRPSCAANDTRRESVFHFDLTVPTEVELSVVSFHTTISLRSVCSVDESEYACTTSGNTLVQSLAPGRYFVIVEGVEIDREFDLFLKKTPIICRAGEQKCTAADTGETCNTRGVAYEPFSCNGDGCDMATGFCSRAEGDICVKAQDATQGFRGTLDLSAYRDDYQSSTCGTTTTTAGKDYTYFVDLPPNTRLDAKVDHNSFDSMALLLVRNCGQIDTTCIAEDTGYTSKVAYINTSTQIERIYIIVDSRSSFSKTVNVEISVKSLICVPNAEVCNGTLLEICNDTGTSMMSVDCLNGCDATLNQCVPAMNNLCVDAIDVSSGGTFTGSMGDYTNNYEANACTNSHRSKGPEGVWFVNALAGQILNVTLTGLGLDSSLYVVSDCANIDATCLGGSDHATVESVNVLIPTDGVYYIMTDTFSNTASGNFVLTVELVTPVCAPGTVVCNNANGIDTCRSDGTGYDASPCPSGCDPVSNSCLGDSCGSAIVINASGQYTGDTTTFSNTYDPGRNGCTGYQAFGNDIAYNILGNPGDIVDLTLTATFDTSIYAVTDCLNLTTCLQGSDKGNPENIKVAIPASGSIFVMVDTYSTNSKGSFTLDVLIQAPQCTIQGTPIQCTDAMTLEYCGEFGLIETYSCACTGGLCDTPKGDICADVVTVTDQTVVNGSFSDFGDHSNPNSGSCPNLTKDYDGKDAVYVVDLPPNTILSVDVQTTAPGAAIYVTSDCTNENNTCVWGSTEDRVEYYSELGGQYFVHLDTTANSTLPFTLTFGIRGGVCQPGSSVCYPNVLQAVYCNADGSQIEKVVDCLGGTCANAFECGGPVQANDTCLTPYIVSAPISYVEDLSRFTDTINPGASSCFGYSTPGPDVIYSVVVPANVVLDVMIDSPRSTRNTIAIVEDCTMPGTTCVAQSSAYGRSTRAVYAAAVDKNVFVIVDHGNNPPDEMGVSIDLRPQECISGEKICMDPNTRQYCDAFFSFVSESCSFGCTAGDCNTPMNDQCGGALDVGMGGVFNENIENFTNDYDQADNMVASCTGFSSKGPDGVWSIQATTGQVLTLSLNTTGYDGSLYISTDCATLVDSCVSGSDSSAGSGTGTETISYTIPADGIYFITADSYSSTPTGTLELNIQLQ